MTRLPLVRFVLGSALTCHAMRGARLPLCRIGFLAVAMSSENTDAHRLLVQLS